MPVEPGAPVSDPTPNAPSRGTDPQTQFAAAVLRAIGAPASAQNISFMLTWFKRENTRAAFNPMATSLKTGSWTPFNYKDGKPLVVNYADFDTGVRATASTLLAGGRYTGIVSDLRQDNPQGAAHNHPDEWRTWSGGGYSSLSLGTVGEVVGGDLGTGGGGGGGATDGGLPDNASPAEIEAFIRTNYPNMAGFLGVPEVRDLLVKAAREDYDIGELEAELHQLTWWKENGVQSRLYIARLREDPAEAEAMLQQRMADLRPDFEQMGSDVSLRAIAEASLKFGWTKQQLTGNFAGHMQYDKEHGGLKQGSIADVSADDLAAIARKEYLVPLLRKDVEQWAIDIYSGKRTEEQFRNFLADQAEARFPGLKEQGVTPGEYLAPLRNIIADTLEMQDADIDLLSPRWSAVLQAPSDGKSAPRPMTMYEAIQFARSQREYEYTKSARDEAASFVDTLGKRMGLTA
jgi:hypothetical protein